MGSNRSPWGHEAELKKSREFRIGAKTPRPSVLTRTGVGLECIVRTASVISYTLFAFFLHFFLRLMRFGIIERIRTTPTREETP